MLNNFFQISLSFFLIYLSYRSNFLMIYNYITGVFLLLFLTNFYFQAGGRNQAEILIFFLNLFFYTVLFISSLFIYFDKENKNKHSYLIPVIVYCIIIFIEPEILRFNVGFFSMFLPITLAFFPLYILKYYRKYIKEENGNF